jgi:hypothetical protein
VTPERSSPLVSQLALWIAFALIVAASVVTVLIPEIESDDSPEEEAEQSEQAAAQD